MGHRCVSPAQATAESGKYPVYKRFGRASLFQARVRTQASRLTCQNPTGLSTQLDFIQTEKNRQVGYTRIASTPKEVIYAAPTHRHCHMVALLSHFAPLFSLRVWRHVPLLVVGAILARGRRMMSTVLRTVGLSQERTFQTSHRVLNRANWSSQRASHRASHMLLHLLVVTFASSGPIVLGIDETIERRREDGTPRSPPLGSIAIRYAPVPPS